MSRNDLGILYWNSIYKQPWVACGQTQTGSPPQGFGILDGGPGMGCSDASISNMGSLSSGDISANPKISTVKWERLGLALTQVLPLPQATLIPSPGVWLWPQGTPGGEVG